MAYPTNKQTIKKNWVNDTPVVNDHPNEHNLVATIVEALQDKVGITNDTNESSIDFKLSGIPEGEKAGTTGATQIVQDNLDDHEGDTSNPHSVTKTQVGLGNVTNDAQVTLTGDQTVAGIKTFSSSPIVPDPTTSTQAVNKQSMDNAISTAIADVVAETKETVGLLTQGKFIDSFESEFKFNHKMLAAETTNTGSSAVDSSDTLDGVSFIGLRADGADVYFYDMTLSGTVYTVNQTITVSNLNVTEGIVRYINSTTAIIAYTLTGTVYVHYLVKTGGTWAVTLNATKAVATVQVVSDIFVDGNLFYVASTTNVATGAGSIASIDRFAYISGNLVADATYSSSVISGYLNHVGLVLNTNGIATLVHASGGSIARFTYTSGSTTLVTNTSGLGGETSVKIIDGTRILTASGTTIKIYTYNGTTHVLESNPDSLPTINTTGVTFAYFNSTLFNFAKKVVLTSTGFENSIEDVTAQGHLGYIVSQTQTLNTNHFDLVVSGSTGNNGTFVPTGTPTLNKVLITTRPTTSGNQTCTISSSLPDRQGHDWMVKGSNYYLGL